MSHFNLSLPGVTSASSEVHLSLFELLISTVNSNHKLLGLQDYLSIRGRIKCEKQSEKRPATDTQLQRMQLCQWQIIFWPLSLSLYGWRLATVTACFLFSCTLQFCDSWRPGSKMLRCSSVWKAAWLFSLLFLLHYLFTYVVCVSVSVTFSLFLYRSLCSHFFSLSSSLSFVVYLSFMSFVFPSGTLQRLGPGPNQNISSGWCLCSKVQRPAGGEMLTHTYRNVNTHKETPAHAVLESTFSTLQAHSVEKGVRRSQCHPLHLMFSCCFCHLCHILEFIWNTVWMLDFALLISSRIYPCPYLFVIQSVAICHFSSGNAVSVFFVLLLSFSYIWHCCGAVSFCPELAHLLCCSALH